MPHLEGKPSWMGHGLNIDTPQKGMFDTTAGGDWGEPDLTSNLSDAYKAQKALPPDYEYGRSLWGPGLRPFRASDEEYRLAKVRQMLGEQGTESAAVAKMSMGLGAAQRQGLQYAAGGSNDPLALRTAIYGGGQAQSGTVIDAALGRAEETAALQAGVLGMRQRQAELAKWREQDITNRYIAKMNAEVAMEQAWQQRKSDLELAKRERERRIIGMVVKVAGGGLISGGI